MQPVLWRRHRRQVPSDRGGPHARVDHGRGHRGPHRGRHSRRGAAGCRNGSSSSCSASPTLISRRSTATTSAGRRSAPSRPASPARPQARRRAGRPVRHRQRPHQARHEPTRRLHLGQGVDVSTATPGPRAGTVDAVWEAWWDDESSQASVHLERGAGPLRAELATGGEASELESCAAAGSYGRGYSHTDTGAVALTGSKKPPSATALT